MSDIPCTERKQIATWTRADTGQKMGETLVPQEHDWRLATREHDYIGPRFPQYTFEVQIAPDLFPMGYKEFWYCIKCRTTEERIVPDVR